MPHYAASSAVHTQAVASDVDDHVERRDHKMLSPLELYRQYKSVRRRTMALVQTLSDEDMVAQSMPDASPTKWHLAHTTWFFETFILKTYVSDYVWFDEHFCHLFNSYYESIGTQHARPQRGLLTRPPLVQVMHYRRQVDDAIETLLQDFALQASSDQDFERIAFLLTVGMHHEMQHQELISTDMLHLLWHNPMFPVVHEPREVMATCDVGSHFLDLPNSDLSSNVTLFEGGVVSVGAQANIAQTIQGFAYDCECPTHKVYLQPFALSNHLVTNGQWLEFIKDEGYQNSLLWLSDGWRYARDNVWKMPLYWLHRDGEYYQFGLDGLAPVDLQAPVCHVSYYEADAFARWAGRRLPKEQEWEIAARNKPIDGNFLEREYYRPRAATGEGLQQLFGDVWEWTQSAFSPYPGFCAEQGALGEYNGKFMSSQFVLRGGSCITPRLQMRSTYRNFFYPHHRWQFSGVRLANDQ